MNKALDLKIALTELFRSGAEGEHDERDMEELLEGIDFHTLLQSLRNDAETMYEYIGVGASTEDIEYYGPALTPQKAVLLWEDVTECVIESAVCTRTLELWLLEDMTFVVTSCFAVSFNNESYITLYRTLKDRDWQDAGMEIDFVALADNLAERCDSVLDNNLPYFEI